MKGSIRFPILPLLAASVRMLVASGAMLTASVACAQTPDPPADHGAAALKRSLLRLSTTHSLLMVTAHPDDEDGGLLTMLARGRGVRVGLVTLTRGEGGQNKIGPELFDALGITRTEELLASDRYYGVEQFFTRAVDYGFSKTLAEALQKWRFADPDGGPVVADLVRVIRRFRPDVLVARFSGTRRDGHAHHEASSILARKAFAEAGDPAKFPDQIREGLRPWQPKKLYVGIIRASEDWTVTEDVGAYDPLLGVSYAQLAWQGLAHQRTQGVGQVAPDPGPRPVYYRRIDGTPAAAVLDAAGKVETPYHEGHAPATENGFFDGIEGAVPAIGSGPGGKGDAGIHGDLAAFETAVADAAEKFDAARPERCAEPLARALAALSAAATHLDASNLSAERKADARFLLDRKRADLAGALDHALSLALIARLEPEKEPGSPFPGFRFAADTGRVAVPGATYPVSVSVSNRSPAPLRILQTSLVAADGWRIEAVSDAGAVTVAPHASSHALFRITVPTDAPPTAPFWKRATVEDALYTVDDPRMIGDPLPPFPLRARVRYAVGDAENTTETIVQTRTIDALRGEIARELLVEPPLSVRPNPPLVVVPLSRVGRAAERIEVEVSALSPAGGSGTATVLPPAGWTVPTARNFSVTPDRPTASVPLSLSVPAGTRPGVYPLHAEAAGQKRTIEFIEHPDIGPYCWVQPADARLEVVDLRLPDRLSIGYVRGAEDSIPEFLQQLGIDVHLLSSDDLAKGDLSRYGTIVTGPRAYDVRDDLRRANGRLLEYARGGGRLVVQYNSGTRAMNAGNYFPYPAKFPDDNDRVTVEDSPVEMLAPQDPIWSYPNRITLRDFDGWVQERGLYFLGEWSPQYTPLLSMHDPDEAPLRGGLLVARVGKGTYVFTAESWFRELPEGVPGAIRIFVNLVSPPPRR